MIEMRFLVCAILLAILAGEGAAAENDAELRVIITNGGVPVPNKAYFTVFPVGQHRKEITHGRGSMTRRVPAGTYDVRIDFQDGAARDVRWLEALRLEGMVERTVEIGPAICQLKVIITNGGVPAPNKAYFTVFPVVQHRQQITHGRGSMTRRLPEGTYDVRIDFQEGAVREVRWLEGLRCEGMLEKVVELGVVLARVKVTVLNEGQDAKHRGWFELHPAGTRDRRGAAGKSGVTIVCKAGSYDIGAFYQDAGASAEKWLPGEKIEGTVERTVELAVPMAQASYRITLEGSDVGGKGWWGIFQPGERDPANRIARVQSGQEIKTAEGTYDVGIFYDDGALKVSRWIAGATLKGKSSESVELGGALASVAVTITRGGKPLPGAWWGLFGPGDATNPLATAPSGGQLRTTAGTYDLGCFYTERGVTAQAWSKGQALSGTVARTIELKLETASLTIKASGNDPGARASGSAPASPGAGAPNLLLILDASGSMWARTEESTRMEVAREVLTGVIKELPDSEINVGLWVYGARPTKRGDCDDVHRLHPLGPVDKPGLLAAFATLRPRGWTPIATALERAAEDLPPGGNNSLVLVTDGIESCGGDPCAAARKLASRGIFTRSFVVGFGLTKDKGRFLDCIGRYYPAQNRAELQGALKEALAASVQPLTGTVTVLAAGSTDRVVAHGTVDQKLVFPAGTYDVAIRVGERRIDWKAVPLAGDVVAGATETPPGR
ncbi:MAG: VWA domain-containing protein [Candidatus Riflebacteria bacterium]|nr:VWA domain-containing protein [Candidatus Riflebacteria bacterium]